MVVVKNVRICKLPEYQPNSVGIVALKRCAYSVWDLLAWGDDAQVNLLSLLHQYIEIGISISESFYRAVRTYEAPFGECLARVLEQNSSGKGLIRFALGDYFVRRYPRALIEMHVLPRENNASFCGICACFGGVGSHLGFGQAVSHVSSLLAHSPVLKRSNNGENAGKCDNPPIGRRFLTVLVALSFCMFVVTYCPSNRLLAWIAGVCFATAELLFFLNDFRWTWCWWW